MADERVWLTHPATGGSFHCPVEAVDEWRKLGWVRGEKPAEVNPVTAEMPREWFEPIPAPVEVADPITEPDDGASTKGSD